MILHTEDIGCGSETIVFLHSGLQTGLTDFENILPCFKDKYRILLPDLRGHGKSESVSFDNYFERTADDLAETINSLNISKIHLAGVSLGALIAVHFASRHESSVKSLTLSGLMFNEPHDYGELHRHEVEIQAKIMKDKETVSYFNNIHPPGWEQFIKISKNKGWYPFTKNAEIINQDLPVHIIIGSRSDHELETITDSIKENALITVVENARHLVNHDSPEKFSEAILNYIKDL